MTPAVGDPVPDFELPDTDGRAHSLDGDAPATVVVFTCNHCPYALAWHDRLLDAAREYAPRGVRFLAVNPNDGSRYPADSYEAMQQRVAAEDWPLPYLHDAAQDVARGFGARTTPDVFEVDSDRRLRYRGAPDADYADPSQRADWLREALDDLLAGREVRRPETEPVGCSVKWRT
ncbi:MAG TPA: thioredoxin family protein [Solirubrobacteraceae bacterium]|nr:thioredoxin family protein [Solirubrobacteraceae bacterium]